jgi:protoporphyrinogen oxidase
LQQVDRLSRIYYHKHYFNYPLSFFNTFWNFGPLESMLCVGSYLRGRWMKPGDDDTFEGWIINRFGKRLYEIFFRTYTEKVWAIPCRDLSANWARQRIRGLSLRVAVQNALGRLRGQAPKTLAKRFLYPKRGPGEFYERIQNQTAEKGVEYRLGEKVTRVRCNASRIRALDVRDTQHQRPAEYETDYVFSSIPLPRLIQMMDPPPPPAILEAAGKLAFRHFLVVNVILDKPHVFPDQWIYVHSPTVKLGRIQNYKNWSPHMVPDARKTSLGLEYFCGSGDALWTMNDIDVIHFAVSELEKIGVQTRRHHNDGKVVRQPDE